MKIIAKKRHIIRRLIFLAVLGLFILTVADNVMIHTTYTRVAIDGLPDPFDDFRIVQVSDLHNNLYGKDQSYLIAKIKEAEPDIIVITGDLIDRNVTDVDNAISFVSRAVKIAPVYYVSGNHESYVLGKYKDLMIRMHEAGAVTLDNRSVPLISDKDQICLAGIRDPAFDWGTPKAVNVDAEIKKALEGVDEDEIKILLSHRPELIKVYSENGIDLALTGHAHGGQVRLPFIGPLYSPSQGILPKYTSGLYEEGGTQMFVSRGLGNGIAPLRINDGPELAVVILEKHG